MSYYLTVLNDKILRLTDGEGASITVGIASGYASILSIVVPEEKRKQGIGKDLLLAAQKLIGAKGNKEMYVDFAQGIEGIRELFESVGYEEVYSVDIISFPMGIILYSSNVKKTMEMGERYSNYLPLEELSIKQMNELFEMLDDAGSPLTCYAMAHFNRQISTVVYDKKNKPVAVILCSDYERDLYVNFMVKRKKADATYNLVAMLGMAEAIKAHGGESTYRHLIFASYNDNVTDLIARLLADENGLEIVGRGISMMRVLNRKKAGDTDYDFKHAPDELQDNLWLREIRGIPFQRNVAMKSIWQRTKDFG